MRDGKRKDNTLLIVGGVFGALLLAGGFAFCALFAFGFMKGWNGARDGTVEPAAAKVWEREEFRTALTKKTQDEVLGILGTPHHTDRVGGNSTWTYHDITRDKVTGKIDSITQVEFKNGVVSAVAF